MQHTRFLSFLNQFDNNKTVQDQKHLDGELRKESQIAWPNMEQRQLDELITPPTEHPSLTVGKIYGALLMFEHWRAFKNRQQEREEYYPAG